MLLPGEMLGVVSNEEKVFKGKCLAPSMKITTIQLTVTSSTVILLAE